MGHHFLSFFIILVFTLVNALPTSQPADALVFWLPRLGQKNPAGLATITPSSWQNFASPVTKTLYSLDFVSSREGWATGDKGTILHWNGTSWEVKTSPRSRTLRSVKALAADDAWAVGDLTTILHWDGQAWTEVPPPPCTTCDTLYSIDMASANNGWAVGAGGKILKWDGSTWYSVTSNITSTLYSVNIVSANNVWIVGERLILHWLDGAWTVFNPPYTILYQVEVLPSGNGWAVGYETRQAKTVTWQYSNQGGLDSWMRFDPPTANPLRSVSMLSAEASWACGLGGSILQWDGEAWQEQASPTSAHLYAIHMLSERSGWAVGAGGTILLYAAPGALISGQVTDSTGAGLLGVPVTITPGDMLVTDASGRYTQTGVITGTYAITPSLAGYVFIPPGLNVHVPPDVSDGNFTAWRVPQADFTAEPVSGTIPLNVAFTNQTSGDYVTTLWDFGDGITSTQANPVHTYLKSGLFNVSLTVSGPAGAATKTRPGYIRAVRDLYILYLPFMRK